MSRIPRNYLATSTNSSYDQGSWKLIPLSNYTFKHPSHTCTINQGCESLDFLLFTKPNFQTFNALKSTYFNALQSSSFQAFQIISHFFSPTLSHPWIMHMNATHLHMYTCFSKCWVTEPDSGKQQITVPKMCSLHVATGTFLVKWPRTTHKRKHRFLFIVCTHIYSWSV